jgi:hypothetical protein
MFIEGTLTLEQVVEKTAHAPARLFDVKDRGYLREGYWADLVLVDMNRTHRCGRPTGLLPLRLDSFCRVFVQIDNRFDLCEWPPGLFEMG